jgi:D-alanyl-D-alanine dipeptidase
MNCASYQVLSKDRKTAFSRPLLTVSIALTAMLVSASDGAFAKNETMAPPSGFSYLRDIAPSIMQDMRYASRNNFTGKILPGYKAGECILRNRVALALSQVQAALKPQGYSLKVYDCYRPARAVRAFGVWAHNLKDLSTKDYYPRLPKTGLFGKGYIARHSGHSIGSTVDLTLVRLPATPQRKFNPEQPRKPCIALYGVRPADNSIDMGTAFDCFDVRSHTNNPRITGQARRNRQKLKSVMTRFGFANYHREWWHYSYKKRTYPRIYHDFPILPRKDAYMAE